MRLRSTDRSRPSGAEEHVADPSATGGGHELIAARDRAYTPRRHKLGRFRWVIVALFAVALCSLAAAVFLTTSHRPSTTSVAGTDGGGWSSWRPPSNGLAGAQEIADYVAPYYRAAPGSQLAVVTVANLSSTTAPVQVIVPTSSSGSELPLPASATVIYNLCGENSSDCSIGVGKPSANRLLLLRREALELALYTFKYITGVEAVVAILPPGYTTAHCTGPCTKSHKSGTKPLDLAIAFDGAELAPWLSRPLRTTLPESLPPTVARMGKAPEAEIVSVLTSKGMFSASTSQAQDGSTLITLSGPLQPQ